MKLDAEAARLRVQLKEVENSKFALEPETKKLDDEESAFKLQRSEFQGQVSSKEDKAGNAAAESRGQLAIINATLDDLQSRISLAANEINEVKGKVKQSEEIAGGLSIQVNDIEKSLQILEHDSVSIDNDIQFLHTELSEEQAHYSETLLESKAWIARSDALSLALEESREKSGIETIEELNGVLGTLWN